LYTFNHTLATVDILQLSSLLMLFFLVDVLLDIFLVAVVVAAAGIVVL
jgi:hypothetical protein